MIVPLAGLFAGIVGLNTYNLAISNSVMNNHISNFKLFCDFVDREIEKRNLIDCESIDYFIIYSKVFPKSKQGIFDCFSEYNKSILNVNNVIKNSNSSYLNSSGKVCVKSKPFNYAYHQYEMKESLIEVGVNVSINHRNVFYEVETQVLELLDVISKAFVDRNSYTLIEERKYL